MSGKGSISRMSDECLMKGKSWLLYFGEYQAGTRKFTLARKTPDDQQYKRTSARIDDTGTHFGLFYIQFVHQNPALNQ